MKLMFTLQRISRISRKTNVVSELTVQTTFRTETTNTLSTALCHESTSDWMTVVDLSSEKINDGRVSSSSAHPNYALDIFLIIFSSG